MKAIIDGLMYDTTASSVIYAEGTEALYKTANGSYFKVCHEGIIPMTIVETKEYLGIHDADTYIVEFGNVPEA